MLRYCMFSWTSTHTSCDATVRSPGVPRVRHATLLDVVLDFHAYTSCSLLCILLDFHAYVMLRYCTLSWTYTQTSSCATVRSLGLPHIRHATLLSFSWTSTHTSCYPTVRSLGLPCMRHATLLYILLDFHAYVMFATVHSWTFTHTSCYAAVGSLRLPCIRHAALLDVVLNFHTKVMLRYCTGYRKGSWNSEEFEALL